MTKSLTKWTSTVLYACTPSQGPGAQVRRNTSLKESPAPPQQIDFCEQVPTDKAKDIVTILQLL